MVIEDQIVYVSCLRLYNYVVENKEEFFIRGSVFFIKIYDWFFFLI